MSGVPVPAPIEADERRRFARVAEVILPRSASMPSASDIAVADALLDRVLRAIPSLQARLHEGLAQPETDGEPALAELRARRPPLFSALVLAALAAYYLSPAVRERIGYGGQRALPIDVHELPGYLEDGSLERVIARGRIYRDLA